MLIYCKLNTKFIKLQTISTHHNIQQNRIPHTIKTGNLL